MISRASRFARTTWQTTVKHTKTYPTLKYSTRRCVNTSKVWSPKMSTDRNYSAAITALNTLQSNFAIVNAFKTSGRSLNERAMPEMREWLQRIGYEPSDLNQINAIHIAGTKGKGSTSAFISSILCEYAQTGQDDATNHKSTSRYPRKIGLYTSPHLRSVRERIQINNEPLSEQLFAQYFFEVWDRLEGSTARLGPPSFLPRDPSLAPDKPVYFQYLTIMAFHTYISEGVDTAVIECGIGGEYDSTNLLAKPVTCGITSLGIDHTAMLGETIDDIAWHKAGIFKSASPSKNVFTVASQPEQAMAVLHRRAEEKGLVLRPISRHKDIDAGTIQLGLAADFQKTNASLAVAITTSHLKCLGVIDDSLPSPLDPTAPLPAEFQLGLQNAKCGGRCEVKRQGNIIWHLDGGHTIESIKLAAEWFASRTSVSSSNPRKRQMRILLFNQQTRDANKLATTLHSALRDALPLLPPTTAPESTVDTKTPATPLFDKAVFSTNITFGSSPPPSSSSSPPPTDQSATTSSGERREKSKGHYKPDLVSINISSQEVEKLAVQNALAETWKTVDQGCDVSVSTSIEEAVKAIRDAASGFATTSSVNGDGYCGSELEVAVLVTGSLHLVGGALEVLDSI